MKRICRPFLALLLSLLLIGSQQAAFAHLLSHWHGGSAVVAQYQDDEGGADHPANACAICIAFAGIGGGAPPSPAPVFLAVFAGDSYCLPLASSVFTRPVITCRARAPPPLL
ncbi:hypothetical protein [Georgfuchsia toluolica]|nr:hypothetical protein [Georgfuchsia toluolica]